MLRHESNAAAAAQEAAKSGPECPEQWEVGVGAAPISICQLPPLAGTKDAGNNATWRPGDVLLAKHVIKLSLTTNSTPRQDSIITSQGRRKRIKCQTIGRNKRTGESEEEDRVERERERAQSQFEAENIFCLLSFFL